MCRVYSYGGIALAIVTQGLILFGNWCANYLCILYWFAPDKDHPPFIKGIPLTFYGLIHWLLFNTACYMAILSHIRGTFANPGLIPDNLELPDYVDTARLNICEKCDNKWKPERAHHCSECNQCVFKVSLPFPFPF